MHFISNLRHLAQDTFLNANVCPAITPARKLELWEGAALPDASELLLITAHFGISVDRLLRKNLAVSMELSRNTRLVVFDVDGVLTDGGMYYTESGDEFKKFNAKDGLAIRRLARDGYITGIISHGINRNLIERRAALLGISKVYTGNTSKDEVLSGWCSDLGILPSASAYIGDDINDLPIIRIAGFTACPSDATELVKHEVDVVLQKRGGEGCVREWIDDYFLLRT
jgi:3-deoxy-D-manno-octulosonate 8-phosphate phosphatase (KDO 8-P phosphatase)